MCDSAACCPLALDVPLPFTRRNFLLFAQHWPQDPTGGQYTIDVFSFSLLLPSSFLLCVAVAVVTKAIVKISDALKCFTKNITASCDALALVMLVCFTQDVKEKYFSASTQAEFTDIMLLY